MQTRRSFLAAAGAGSLGGLAGCTGLPGGGGGGSGSGGGSGGDGSGGVEGPTLQSLDVAGSPGGPVPVLADGPTLLDFWATWCAPCKPQMAELRAVRRQLPGVHMLSITNEGDTAAIRSFWREYEGTWAVAQDTDLRTNERFGVTRVPTLLVFDADGTEQWRHVGLAAADSVREQLVAAGATPASATDGGGGSGDGGG